MLTHSRAVPLPPSPAQLTHVQLVVYQEALGGRRLAVQHSQAGQALEACQALWQAHPGRDLLPGSGHGAGVARLQHRQAAVLQPQLHQLRAACQQGDDVVQSVAACGVWPQGRQVDHG
jgi:hypothetical protein